MSTIIVDAPVLQHLKGWQGRSETQHDQITATPVRAQDADGWLTMQADAELA